jgi:hypothetical protein
MEKRPLCRDFIETPGIIRLLERPGIRWADIKIDINRDRMRGSLSGSTGSG